MKELWIETGYAIFAKKGPQSLKIEPLSKAVNKSKSSFYHHFADLEVFFEELFKFHLNKAKKIAELESKAKNIHPELIQILFDHKEDILFNRQLRFNRHISSFNNVLIKSNEIVGNSFVNVWIEDLKLNVSHNKIEGVFTLALDNFFLHFNENNFNIEELSSYFFSLKNTVLKIVKE